MLKLNKDEWEEIVKSSKSNCALDDACRSENYPTIKEGDLVKWNDPAIDDFELNERELQKKPNLQSN